MVLVLVGTGTSVGKTYVGERLLRAATALGARAFGYKPVESGFTRETPDTDAARLSAASPFHVKHPPLRYVLPAPISPHLAAREVGVRIDLDAIRAQVARLAADVDLLLLELPGGAFSPFTEEASCIQVARSVPGARILLVAPDRLGVLHDIGATARACASVGAPLVGVVLSAPETPDDSTGRNAAELPLVTVIPLLATFPRGPADAPVRADDPARPLAARFLPAR